MFGDKLRYFRKKANLSQKQLAQKIGFPQTTISDWELNKYEPGFTIAIRILDALGISLTDLNEVNSRIERKR